MPASVSIEIPRLAEVVGKIQGMGPAIKAEQRAAMTKATNLLADEARSRIHSRSTGKGSAREGIKPRVSGAGAGYVNTKNKAAKFSQIGRRPGKAPRASMIAKKLGLEPDEAFLVARAIGRRGMKGRPVMRPAMQARRSQVERIFHEAVRRVVGRVR